MIVIAHRGANREAEENTMEAFQAALEAKAQRIELDVHLSLDRKLVIYHDFRWRLGRKFVPIANCRHEDLRLASGEFVPRLEEVLASFGRHIEFNVEIKPETPTTATAVIKCLKGRRGLQRIILSSFSGRCLETLQQVGPSFERACLLDLANVKIRKEYGTIQNFMNHCGAKILHPHMAYATVRLMELARRQNWEVCTWAPMKAERFARERSWRRLHDLGVDGHCTNYPREMVRWVQNL
jgi:glycerophosphoryl diester phosphodiesterase